MAELEFAEAVEYYNQESEGLGFKFAAEVKRTLERIVQFPKAWMPYPNAHAVVEPTDSNMV